MNDIIAISNWTSLRTYSKHDADSIRFEFNSGDFDDDESKLKIYLIHNFFDYYLNLTVYSEKNSIIQQKILSYSNQTNPQNTSSLHQIQLSSIPMNFQRNQFKLIQCFASSPFTEYHQISHCNPKAPALIQIIGEYVLEELFEIDFEDHSKVIFEINPFYGRPIDFVSAPQMYFAGWTETNHAALTITGLVFLPLSIISLIILISIMISGIIVGEPPDD
jgi:hypothetical protein